MLLIGQVLDQQEFEHLIGLAPKVASEPEARLLNKRLRAVEPQRKVRETNELEERLQGLERILEGAENDAGRTVVGPSVTRSDTSPAFL